MADRLAREWRKALPTLATFDDVRQEARLADCEEGPLLRLRTHDREGNPIRDMDKYVLGSLRWIVQGKLLRNWNKETVHARDPTAQEGAANWVFDEGLDDVEQPSTPEKQAEHNELIERLNEVLPAFVARLDPTSREVFEDGTRGVPQTETADRLKVTRQAAHQRWKRLCKCLHLAMTGQPGHRPSSSQSPQRCTTLPPG